MPERLININMVWQEVPKVSLHHASAGINGQQLIFGYRSDRKEEQSQGLVRCQTEVLQSFCTPAVQRQEHLHPRNAFFSVN